MTGSSDGTAILWDLSGNELARFSVDRRSVFSVAYSPRGDGIVTGSSENAVLLWRDYFWEWEHGRIYKLNAEERAEYGIDWEY